MTESIKVGYLSLKSKSRVSPLLRASCAGTRASETEIEIDSPKSIPLYRLLGIMINHRPPQLPHLREELLPMLVRRREDVLRVDSLLCCEFALDLVDSVGVGFEGDVAVLLDRVGHLFGREVGADVSDV